MAQIINPFKIGNEIYVGYETTYYYLPMKCVLLFLSQTIYNYILHPIRTNIVSPSKQITVPTPDKKISNDCEPLINVL